MWGSEASRSALSVFDERNVIPLSLLPRATRFELSFSFTSSQLYPTTHCELLSYMTATPSLPYLGDDALARIRSCSPSARELAELWASG